MTDAEHARTMQVNRAFDLRHSVGPARWVGDRSPRHAWTGNSLTWCGREGETPVFRTVRQPSPGSLAIEGDASASQDGAWVQNVLMVDATVDEWADPVLATIARRFPGVAPYGDGSLFEGLITSIVGQSISVASAAVTQRRLAFLFHDGIDIDGRTFAPLPSAVQLADASVALIRSSGVTTRRAEALRVIGRKAADGEFPSDNTARSDPDGTEQALLDLPQVGKWTAASAVHWGVGSPDAWPPGDVALLRAVRFAFDNTGLTMVDIDRMAEAWRPYRGVAARLLWTNLFDSPSVKDE